MALITKIEVSNFLNTERVDPWDPNWKAHWPHLCIDFDGKSGIGRVDNGRGKTRLCNALFTILTRDRTLHSETRKLLAPSRKKVSSHVRVEVKQQISNGTELFESGVEYYVMGFYGCYDTELTFYLYQGKLTDCPIALTSYESVSKKIELIPDKQFKEQLKKQKGGEKNRNRSEYLEAINLLFDMGFLQQQLNYQKTGGGDGTGSFFSLQGTYPKGEDFSTSFFYEHIAPHLLVDVMGSFAEEDEKHFVDTLVKSSRKVVNLEFKQEKAEQDSDQYNTCFTWLDEASTLIKEYQSDKNTLHTKVSQLNHQLMMIDRITNKQPLSRLAVPVGCEPLQDNQVSKSLIANQLSYYEGEWLISDKVLEQYLKSNVSSINKLASKIAASSKVIKASQVIEITRNLKNKRDLRGNPNHYYPLHSAIQLISSMSNERVIVEGGKEHLLRCINYGFDIRSKLPSPNPAYDALKQLKDLIETQKSEYKDLQLENGALTKQRTSLQNSVEKYELNEQAYLAMCESVLFSKEELEEPKKTFTRIQETKEKNGSDYEALVDQNTKLAPLREHYKSVKEKFGELENYSSLLSELETKSSNLDREKESAANELSDKHKQLDNEKEELERLNEEADSLGKQINDLTAKKGDYDAVSEYYTDEALAVNTSLQEALKNEVEVKSQKVESVKQGYQTVCGKLELLNSVIKDYLFVKDTFKCEQPKQFLAAKQKRQNELASEISKYRAFKDNLDAEFDKIPASSSTCRDIKNRFSELLNETQLNNLEFFIDKKLSELEGQLTDLEKEWKSEFDYTSAIENFENNHEEDIDSVIDALHEEYRTRSAAISKKRKELDSLKTQHDQLLKNGEITPSNLVNDVHQELDFSGTTVQQVISEMKLPENRLAELLTEFSSVLHAPIADSYNDAITMLEQLISVGKDYPVFYKEKLTSYCQHADRSSALLPYESLHVKVLTDNNFLPELLARLEKQINTLKTEIEEAEIALQQISPESEQYKLLQTVKEGYEKDIKSSFINSSKRIDNLVKELQHIKAIKASREYLLIKVAQHYEQIGGDTHLNSIIEQKIKNDSVLLTLDSENEELSQILTERNIAHFQNASRFCEYGGIKTLRQLESDKTDSELTQAKLKKEFDQLKEKEVNCYSRLQNAQLFVKNGGLPLIYELTSKLVNNENKIVPLNQSVLDTDKTIRNLTRKVSELSEKYTQARGQYLEWKSPLESAALYLTQSGLEFDLAFQDKRLKLADEKRVIEQKLQFNFGLAQDYVNVKDDENYNEKLISKIQNINETIARNDQEIQRISDAVEEHQNQISEKHVRANEYQKEYLKFQRLQQLSSSLISYLQTEVEVTYEETEPTSHTQYAIDIESEIRAEQTNDHDHTAELYLNLFDAIEGLELEDSHGTISNITKVINNKQANLISNIDANLKTDGVVRDAERQELKSNNISRIISAIQKLKPNIEKAAIDKEKLVERTAEDVRNQKQNLANSMVLLTNTLKDNLKLMKSSLVKGNGQAGFSLDANIVPDDQIQHQIEKMIASVKLEEERFQNDVNNPDKIINKTEAQHIASLQEKLKLEFNRSVFIGKDDKFNNLPSIKVIHPRLTASRMIPLSEKFSVGQRAAIGLLLLVKLAAFNSERVNNTGTINRSNRNLIPDKVVIIDGLFSNLSDRKMINDSLETVMNIKDEFQIIGWLHNPYYKNNFDIFPRFYNISPASKKGVLLQASRINPDDNSQMVAMTLQLEKEEQDA